MESARAPIGIFDSGFGGMAILKEIQKVLPDYDYVYLGDTARTPYGNRSQEVIYQFTLEAVEFLFGKGCPLIIIACNTASAEALRKIQQEYLPKAYPDRRILGVVIPAVEEAAAKTKNNKVGVLATQGTVRSEKFVRELHKYRPEIEVFQHAAPLLVPLVEENMHNSEAARLILRTYLEPLVVRGIDTLILGCTHYGHVEKMIREEVGEDIVVISEGPVVAVKLAEYLTRHEELELKISRDKSIEFYTTDTTERFQETGEKLFGSSISAKKAVLGKK